MSDLTRAMEWADHCHGIVVRDGIEDACGKPPTSIIDGRSTEDDGYWPACTYHANRYGRGNVVPLPDLLHIAWEQGAQYGSRGLLPAASRAIRNPWPAPPAEEPA